MATLLRSRRVVPHLPTKTSLFLLLPSSCRTFHATPRPQFFETALQTTQSLFDGIHTITGLPWAYTIPLSALAIRASLILPLGIYARRTSQKQAAFSPLLGAWAHIYRKDAMTSVGRLGPEATQKVVVKKMLEKRKEIFGRYGCQYWKLWIPVVQLPIWLIAVEAIRKMSGARAGIFGLLFGTSQEEGASIPAALSTSFEPSLATEGALWFPNLLIPDSGLVLPFVLSGMVLLNVHHSFAGPVTNRTAWQKGLRKSMFLVGLAIGPLTLQVPSGLLLYLISSSSFALGQAVLLDKLMPIKNHVTSTHGKASNGITDGKMAIKR